MLHLKHNSEKSGILFSDAPRITTTNYEITRKHLFIVLFSVREFFSYIKTSIVVLRPRYCFLLNFFPHAHHVLQRPFAPTCVNAKWKTFQPTIITHSSQKLPTLTVTETLLHLGAEYTNEKNCQSPFSLKESVDG